GEPAEEAIRQHEERRRDVERLGHAGVGYQRRGIAILDVIEDVERGDENLDRRRDDNGGSHVAARRSAAGQDDGRPARLRRPTEELPRLPQRESKQNAKGGGEVWILHHLLDQLAYLFELYADVHLDWTCQSQCRVRIS